MLPAPGQEPEIPVKRMMAMPQAAKGQRHIGASGVSAGFSIDDYALRIGRNESS